MADSKRLAIIKNIQAALQAISVASGYNYTVPAASVVYDPAVNLLGMNGADLPFMVIEATPDGGKDYYPAEQLREIFRVNIYARIDVDSSDPTARATGWERLAQDIEKALTQDLTRGGNAVDTRLGVPSPFIGVGSNIVILLQPVEIRIYRSYGSA